MWLYIVVVIMLLVIIFALMVYIVRIRKEIREIREILEDIKEQDSHQKFLIKSGSNIDKIKSLLNQIFYEYDSKVEEFMAASYANQHLMTSLSHDIRTPMTTLMGYLDAVYLRLVGEGKREENISLAKNNAYEIKEYMEALFEWFRLNSNEEVFHIEIIDITEKSRQVLTDWIPVFEENGIDYEIEIPESIMNIQMDCSSYSRIINNIIQNILVHSKADKICINIFQHNGMFVIKIEDNGIGIPKENLKYIFERLYKCDESRHDKGSGLGLNIVKILTEKMGGIVEANSEIGKGTEFILRFPLVV